jgi:hypothetical protein
LAHPLFGPKIANNIDLKRIPTPYRSVKPVKKIERFSRRALKTLFSFKKAGRAFSPRLTWLSGLLG